MAHLKGLKSCKSPYKIAQHIKNPIAICTLNLIHLPQSHKFYSITRACKNSSTKICHFINFCVFFLNTFPFTLIQDYLGAIIVFVAIQTALITSQILPDESLPSLVGLALQYTLLIPIYLNWVVKLFADMEMYFGACERISYCIENDYQEVDAVNVCKFGKKKIYLDEYWIILWIPWTNKTAFSTDIP